MGRGRPPLPLETWGKIQRYDHKGTPAARANVRDADGELRRVMRTGRTYADAENNLKRALRDRPPPAPEYITRESRLAVLAAQWLESLKNEERATATISRYRSTIRSHVMPMKNLRLVETTVPRLQRLVDEVTVRSGPAAARMLVVVLKGMFAMAVRFGALQEDPAAYVRAPKRKRNAVHAPGIEQIHELRRLLAAHDRRPAVRGTVIRDLADIGDVLIGTGARIGEVLALTWRDVDLESGRVTIASTVVRSPGQGIVVQPYPKSESSIRRLPVPAFVWELFARRRREAYCDLVFPSLTGTPRWPENVRTQWANAVQGTELEGATPRACRKAVATLLEATEDIEAAAGQLGHSTSKITQLFYVPMKVDRRDYSTQLSILGAEPRADFDA